jgi:hypothetical protein
VKKIKANSVPFFVHTLIYWAGADQETNGDPCSNAEVSSRESRRVERERKNLSRSTFNTNKINTLKNKHIAA